MGGALECEHGLKSFSGSCDHVEFETAEPFSDEELADVRRYADGFKGAPVESLIKFLNGGLARLLARLDHAEEWAYSHCHVCEGEDSGCDRPSDP